MSRRSTAIAELLAEPAASRRVGPFLLVEQLGRGGFAPVWLAKEVYDGAELRRVAVKLFATESTSGASRRDEILAEARALCRVDHPNVVRFLTFAIDDARGIVGLVMDYVEGQSLANRLAVEGRLSVDATLVMGCAVASALVAVHKAGLVHRDVKPANVVQSGSRVRLIDFGIAALDADGPATFVVDDLPLVAPLPRHTTGSLGYTDPACLATGAPATPSSDLYGLGALLFECLTGRLPAVAVGREGLDRDVLEGRAPAPLLETIVPEAPAALAALVDQLIRPLRAERPPSAEDVARALERVLLAHPAAAVTERAPVAAQVHLDDNVQFTVYRPRSVAPDRWHPLLAFAHLSERRADAPPEETDPLEEVQRQAAHALGARAKDYVNVTQDSAQAVPEEGELTFVPDVPGVEFNPSRRTFLWKEPVHREDFRLRANATLLGKTARGRLTVYLGSLLLAEVSLAFRVERAASTGPDAPTEAAHARVYRKVYAAYSHRDVAVVEEFERYARALGDDFLRDEIQLRTGEAWSSDIASKIEQADVFQLFWSTSAMGSPLVRREWEHALSLARPDFVRPTYWEEPLPSRPEEGLPPRALLEAPFRRIRFAPEQRAGVEVWPTLAPPPAPALAPAPVVTPQVDGDDTPLAAMRSASVERARLDLNQTTRLEAVARGQAHERALGAVEGKISTSWTGRVVGALVVFLVAGGVALYTTARMTQMTASRPPDHTTAEVQERADRHAELHRLNRELKATEDTIARLEEMARTDADGASAKARLEEARESHARAQRKLAALQDIMAREAGPRRVGPCTQADGAVADACAPGDPLCSCL